MEGQLVSFQRDGQVDQHERFGQSTRQQLLEIQEEGRECFLESMEWQLVSFQRDGQVDQHERFGQSTMQQLLEIREQGRECFLESMEWSLSLSNVMGKLTSMSDLGSPPGS